MHLKSPFILNGVCVFWRGWIDIQRLEGFGCLEFDTEGAQMEDSLSLQDRIGQSQFEHISHKQQQLCNNQLLNNMNQQSPLGRLSNPLDGTTLPIHHHHHHHLSPPNHLAVNNQSTPPQQQQQTQSQQQPPPLGLNPCIGPAAPVTGLHHLHTPSHPPPPPVSMTDSALHYSNAIAAAAVYQAFSGQPHSQVAAALHGLNSQVSSAMAAAPLAASLAASNGQIPQLGANVRFPMNSALNLCDVNTR